MFTTGRSMSGNSRRLRPNAAASPRMNSSSDITVASTGRRTDISASFMRRAPSLPHAHGSGAIGLVGTGGRRVRHRIGCQLGGTHWRAVAHFLRTFDDDSITGLETGQHFHAAGTAIADAHFEPLGL